MNDAPLGTYSTATAYAAVADDIYAALITKAEVKMDKDDPRLPFTDKFGKNRLIVTFQLDDEFGPDNGPITLRRDFAISYGATAGTYSALATFIEAAMGIKCGDKAQRNVRPSEILNRALRVQVKNIEKDDKTFCNVVGTFPPKADARLQPAPQPFVTQAARDRFASAVDAVTPKSTADKLGLEDADLDEIPF